MDDRESDDRLLIGLRADSAAARATLYERYASHVRRVVARIVGVDHELPDILHDTFVSVFEGVHQVEDASRLKAWITSVAIFTARGRIRKRQRAAWLCFVAPSELPEPAAQSADHEARQFLTRTFELLGRLPARVRIVFCLRHLEGMQLREVADACDCSLATVKRRLRDAERRFLNAARKDSLLGGWASSRRGWRRS